MYYDKFGFPIDAKKWSLLFNDVNYQRILRTELIDGTIISTVWTGIDSCQMLGDSNLPPPPKTIFETAIFEKDWTVIRTYGCQVEAVNGHNEIVNQYIASQEKAKNLFHKRINSIIEEEI